MGDSGSARFKVLGISSVVVILALAGGAVFAQISDDGLKCESGVRSYGVGEPDLTEITAKSPEEALMETISEDGKEYVGLRDVTGSPSELAAGFTVVARDPEVPESIHEFEYKDDAGAVLARVQVEAVGDGRYFVGSVQSCAGGK